MDNGSGHTPERVYLWGMDLSGSIQGAGGVGGLLSMTVQGTSPATYYPTYDGNGNISEYIDVSGTKAAHFEYEPFGNLTEDSEDNAGEFPYRFSTKPQDAATGLYYYGYRFYDPETGRWSSRDPIKEEGGVNLYGFVGNDGVRRIDKFGLAPKEEEVAVEQEIIINIFDQGQKELVEYGGLVCCWTDMINGWTSNDRSQSGKAKLPDLIRYPTAGLDILRGEK